MSNGDRCPLCKTSSNMVDTFSLVFTLVEWPLALIFAGSVCIFAGIADLGVTDAFLFILLAVMPLGFKTLRKKSCLHCHIEFIPEDCESAEHHSLGA